MFFSKYSPPYAWGTPAPSGEYADKPLGDMAVSWQMLPGLRSKGSAQRTAEILLGCPGMLRGWATNCLEQWREDPRAKGKEREETEGPTLKVEPRERREERCEKRIQGIQESFLK